MQICVSFIFKLNVDDLSIHPSNKRFTLDKVREVLVLLLLLFGFGHVVIDNIAKACTIEESAGVFEHIFWSIIEHLADE